MSATVQDTRRVAKNTLLLYFRMLIVMGVSIFTSRIILESLGIDNYGILNVVGGIAFSFGFFSSSMSNATQRYLSFGHGEGNIDKVKEYFNIISLLYIIASAIILIIGGSLGFWIVSKLNIPPQNYWGGVVVYYTTLFSLLITIFSSVFDSVMIAREEMNFYAYISIAEVVLKLGLAYLIFTISAYKLQVYSILLLAITVIVKGSMWIYCRKHYPECRFNLKWQPEKIKGTLSFIGWNGLGTIIWVINEQGVNILLNLFFGPVVNAARGIANQVNTALNNFVSNFYLALNPQIIKTYAAGEQEKCIDMMCKASLLSFLLLWMLSLPVIIRRNYILHLWLKDVPDYTSVFLLWILIYSLINVLTRPQWTVIQAVGNLKSYIINGSISMIGAIPIGYLLYRRHFPPQSILIVLAFLRLIYVIVSLRTIKNFIFFSYTKYIKEVLFPIIVVGGGSLAILETINNHLPQNFIGLIFTVLFSSLAIGGSMLVILPSDMRVKLISKFSNKIK